MKPKTHIMLDLETIGTKSNSGIIAVGAVWFDPFACTRQIREIVYAPVEIGSLIYHGFKLDEDTLEWWGNQKDAAKKAAFLPDGNPIPRIDIKTVLEQFSKWVCEISGNDFNSVVVWGNGANFDNRLLGDAYTRMKLTAPWKFWNDRCYRTLKNLYPAIKIERGTGTHHNAADDALAQTKHLLSLPLPTSAFTE